MDSNVVTKALLESAIESLELKLAKTIDEDERSGIIEKIAGLAKYLRELFPEQESVEILQHEFNEIFKKLEATVYPEGRTPPS